MELARVAEDLAVARPDVLDPDRRVVEPDRVAAHDRQRNELVDRPVLVDHEVRADTRQLAELDVGCVAGEVVVGRRERLVRRVVLDDHVWRETPARDPVVADRVRAHLGLPLGAEHDRLPDDRRLRHRPRRHRSRRPGLDEQTRSDERGDEGDGGGATSGHALRVEAGGSVRVVRLGLGMARVAVVGNVSRDVVDGGSPTPGGCPSSRPPRYGVSGTRGRSSRASRRPTRGCSRISALASPCCPPRRRAASLSTTPATSASWP